MAIAVTEPTPEVATSSNASSYSLAAFTPTANSVLVAMAFATGTTAAGSMTGGGLSWTRLQSQLYNTTDTAYLFYAVVGGSPSSTTITFSCSGDSATGCVLMAFQITGAHGLGTGPIRQSNKKTGTTSNPNITMTNNMLTIDAYCAGFGIPRSPPTSSAPAGWTEIADIGYSTPTSGASGAYRATGETGASITFTSASGNWGSLAIEIYIQEYGTSSGTFDSIGLTATGEIPSNGILSKTFDDLSIVANGLQINNGILSKTFDDIGLVATGHPEVPEIVGTLTQTFSSISLSANGTITAGTITGEFIKDLSTIIGSLSGEVVASGNLTQLFEDISPYFTGEAIVWINCISDGVLDNISISSTGTVLTTGYFDRDLESIIGALGGMVIVGGNLSTTFNGLGLSASGIATDVGDAFGVMDQMLDNLGITSSGAMTVSGSNNTTFSGFSLLGTAITSSGGIFNQTLSGLQLYARGEGYPPTLARWISLSLYDRTYSLSVHSGSELLVLYPAILLESGGRILLESGGILLAESFDIVYPRDILELFDRSNILIMEGRP